MVQDAHADEVAKRNSALSKLLGRQLDVPGQTLSRVTSNAGRSLPRGLRRDAQDLIEAEQLAAHPKLRVQVDPRRLRQADRRLRAHARTLDPAEARKGRLLQLLGGIAFNLLILAALVIGFLAWRGLIGPG
ncbi:hypothetical protein [Pseudoruegeria sp. SK021]|uniref:hypothetical protein n=1 Tax=Pseudoruegeria sp. SK021 TaxID=1933035 RepID=UPI000A23E538|nr:hypothetical protein [Pseudoruegeria sp. SK021]OSP53874.1 hypothetical protein BV911_15440 [Pseudoruegeria sp. SK021]